LGLYIDVVDGLSKFQLVPGVSVRRANQALCSIAESTHGLQGLVINNNDVLAC
jgi:hypothetical protein